MDDDAEVISSDSDDEENKNVRQKRFVAQSEVSAEEHLKRFRAWMILHANDASHVEDLIDLENPTKSRVPKSKFSRDLGMKIMSCAADLSLTGNEAAEVLIAGFPKIFLRKGVEVCTALAELIEEKVPAPRAEVKPISKEEGMVRALTA